MKRQSIVNLSEYEEIPYTVIGHASLPPQSFHIVLTGKGLKAIVEKMAEGDDLRITVHATKKTTFEIISLKEED